MLREEVPLFFDFVLFFHNVIPLPINVSYEYQAYMYKYRHTVKVKNTGVAYFACRITTFW